MKFKHTVSLLIDNFKTTYKLLVYRTIITVISMLAYYGFITLLFKNINNFPTYTILKNKLSDTLAVFLDGDLTRVGENIPQIVQMVKDFLQELSDNTSIFVAFVIEILAVALVTRFLQGLGNYTASVLVNDKMAMQADSPFIVMMIKNLGKASAYSGIYVPITLIYDCLSMLLLYFVLFKLAPLPFMALVFLAVLCMILLIALKLTFTTDWLPAMICGKKNVGKAMGYALARKSKGTFSVYLFYAFSCVLIMGVTVALAVFTLGVGTIIALPFTYVYLFCYQFANYYDNNEIKFFIDKRTIVRPEHEKELSREDFLRGE